MYYLFVLGLHPWISNTNSTFIIVYGSTPYVGMTPNKNGGHIKSVQMTLEMSVLD